MSKSGSKKSNKPITNKDLNLDIKAHTVYEMLRETDPKKAFKSVKKSIDQSKYLVEELFYKIALSYLYETSYRSNHVDIEEYTAHIPVSSQDDLAQSQILLNYVAEQIIANKIFERFIVDHFMTITRELGYSEIAVKLIEAKFDNDPNDKEAALQLFDTYVANNDFMKMNAVSNKISMSFGLPDYSVHSIQSLYMLSQTPTSPPNMIDLAFMFCKKQVDTHTENGDMPSNIGKLYAKILVAKQMYTEAVEFITANPKIYSSEFDLSREVISILEQQVSHETDQNSDQLRNTQIKLIKEVYKVIVQNYKNPTEFRPIYDLYELLVNTLVNLVKSELPDQKLEDVYSEAQQSEVKDNEDLENGDGTYNIDSVKTLWSNLIYYQDFELSSNKSTEAHNLRKASLLSQLYLSHRLVIGGIQYNTESPSKPIFHEISLIYAKRYLHLSSTVYDLKGYFAYLDDKFTDDLTTHLSETSDSETDNKKIKIRFMSKVTILKFRKLLGQFDQLDSIKFIHSEEFNTLISEYFELYQIEDVPEKGELRVSDNYIFVIEEILRDSVTVKNHLALDGVKLFRIALLEYCLKQSIYNFDIAIQLTKLYMDLNIHEAFSSKLKYFEFKGVQLESLGYIAIKHMMSHNDEDSLKFWYKKYYKYLQKNSKDLHHLKSDAMKAQNYEKVDEFFSYESYHDKSYFQTLVKYLYQTIELRNKISNDSQASGVLQTVGGSKYQYTDETYNNLDDDKIAEHFTRTQDLGVFLSKFESIPKSSDLSSKWPISDFYTTAKDDPIFGHLKFSKTCNYKPNLLSSLSIFEHPVCFQVYKGLHYLTNQLNQPTCPFEAIESIIECVKAKFNLNVIGDDELSKFIWSVFEAWLNILQLTVIAKGLKEHKSDKEKLAQEIEDRKNQVEQLTKVVKLTFEDDAGVWKRGIDDEEVKLDGADLKKVQEYSDSGFRYSNVGHRISVFFSNYCQGLNVALRQLNDSVSALAPKKKKKNQPDSGLSALSQPCKDMLKAYKQWVNTQIDLYKNDDSKYDQFLDQLNGHYSEYLTTSSLNSHSEVVEMMNETVTKIIDDLKTGDKILVNSLETTKVYIKNMTF